MTNRVRLNIELPASVRDALKAEAAIRGIPLRELVLAALGVQETASPQSIPEVTIDETDERPSA